LHELHNSDGRHDRVTSPVRECEVDGIRWEFRPSFPVVETEFPTLADGRGFLERIFPRFCVPPLFISFRSSVFNFVFCWQVKNLSEFKTIGNNDDVEFDQLELLSAESIYSSHVIC